MGLLDQPTHDPTPAEASSDGQVSVLISPDRMSAEVLVTAPVGSGKPATVEDVLAKLQEAGVVYGIDVTAVEWAVAQSQLPPDPYRPLEKVNVAQGREPGVGADARVEYHPCLTDAGGRPKVNPDGTVNLFDLNLVRNISKGTVLAVLTPATRGEPGRKVTGAEIPGRMGREIKLRAGKGAVLSEDGCTAIAAVDGHATLVHGEVTVTDVFEVRGDVGVGTGNIGFVGTVIVRGSIRNGFAVKAEGDVEVLGGVDGGSIEATGNVTIRYGVAGGGHSRVVAGGAVKARFIENAEVRAGTYVWASDGILHSKVEAGAGVEVLGRRGAIIGGSVIARNSVAARNLGSDIGELTEITVGVVPEVREELKEVNRKLESMDVDLQRLEQTIQFLTVQHRYAPLSQERRALLAKAVKWQEQLHALQEELKARKQELERRTQEARSAWVLAKGSCHHGVRLAIGAARLQVTDSLERVRFRLNEDQEIEALPA
ncbi:MAG: FapA family protein [Sphingomonadaceae bacterium]